MNVIFLSKDPALNVETEIEILKKLNHVSIAVKSDPDLLTFFPLKIWELYKVFQCNQASINLHSLNVCVCVCVCVCVYVYTCVGTHVWVYVFSYNVDGKSFALKF